MKNSFAYREYGKVPSLLARKSPLGSRLTPEQRRNALDNLGEYQLADAIFRLAVYAGVPTMMVIAVAMARAAGL